MPRVSVLGPGFTPTAQFWNPKSKYYTRPVLEDGREKNTSPYPKLLYFLYQRIHFWVNTRDILKEGESAG